MYINPINQNFMSSRVKAPGYPAKIKRSLEKLPELQIIADKRNVYFKLSPSKNDLQKTMLTVFKRGIDHIADIPGYAMTHDTGDQVYINWETTIYEGEVPNNKEALVERVKQIFGYSEHL